VDSKTFLGKCAIFPIKDLVAGPVGALVLLGLIGLGLDMIVSPRRHVPGHMRSGGEMLREWNELQIQILGLLLIFGAGWGVYRLGVSVWSTCLH